MRSYSRYSHHARRALSHARALVNRYHHPQMDSGHILGGVLLTESSLGCRVLQAMNLTAARAEPYLRTLYPIIDVPTADTAGDDVLDDVLALAENESNWLGHHYVGTEHLLLGITRTNLGNASALLRLMHTSSEEVRRHVRRALREGTSEMDLQFVKRSARLSELSRRVISAAEQMAADDSGASTQPSAGIGHLLLVLLLESRSSMSSLLRESNLREDHLRDGLAERDPALMVSVESILNQALDPVESVGSSHSSYTSTDQILLTLALDPEGAGVLRAYGVNVNRLLRRLKPDLR